MNKNITNERSNLQKHAERIERARKWLWVRDKGKWERIVCARMRVHWIFDGICHCTFGIDVVHTFQMRINPYELYSFREHPAKIKTNGSNGRHPHSHGNVNRRRLPWGQQSHHAFTIGYTDTCGAQRTTWARCFGAAVSVGKFHFPVIWWEIPAEFPFEFCFGIFCVCFGHCPAEILYTFSQKSHFLCDAGKL